MLVHNNVWFVSLVNLRKNNPRHPKNNTDQIIMSCVQRLNNNKRYHHEANTCSQILQIVVFLSNYGRHLRVRREDIKIKIVVSCWYVKEHKLHKIENTLEYAPFSSIINYHYNTTTTTAS